MIRFVALLLVWSGVLTGGVVAAAPIVRVSLSANQVLVGEPLKLSVDVLVPGWFTAPVELPASLPVERATVRRDDGAALNLSERIDGVAYAGMRHTYSVTAHGAGALSIQPFAVGIHFSDGAHASTTREQTGKLTFLATLPRGAERLGYFLATKTYHVTDRFDRPLKNLKPGDAVTRTIIQKATGTAAMNLPALAFPPVAGLAIYPDEGIVEDIPGERGAAHQAMRRQTIRYVLLEAGSYQLAGVRIEWFDADARTMRVAATPDVALEVRGQSAAPPVTPSIAPVSDLSVSSARLTSQAFMTGQVLLPLFLLLWLGRGWLARVPAIYHSWRERSRLAEPAAFRRLVKSLRRRVAAAVICDLAYRWLSVWRQTYPNCPGGNPPSVAGFVAGTGDPLFGRVWADLERQAYAASRDVPCAGVDYRLLTTQWQAARKVRLRMMKKMARQRYVRELNDPLP